MANYSDIKGFTVQTLSSDTVASQAEGGSWASGGSLSTARTSAQSSGSGNDNAILAGGYLATASPTSQAACESYNGTAWTEVSEMNTARQFGQGLGTNTAAIIVGGPPSTSAVEQWNGSSWTEKSEVNTGRILGAALGTTTAGLYAGGGPPPGGMTNVESWDGSSWTETSYDLNTGKYYMWGTGLNTNAIVSGTPTTTEEFNGSSWTETTESSTNHRSGAAGGVKTDALVWGGDSGPGYTGKTEVWNGSSWTELNDMTQPKSYTGGTENGPGSVSALAYGGSTPSQVTATEEWSAPAIFSKITQGQLFFNSTTNTFKETILDIPGTSWASGGNMNNSLQHRQSAGITTAAIAATGIGPAPSTPLGGRSLNVEQYDGSSWTEVGDVSTGRNQSAGTPASPYSSAMVFAGDSPPSNAVQATSESWNGSSWSETADLSTARTQTSGAGASNTAALCVAGSDNPNQSPIVAVVEQWDGSSWTEVGDVNTARRENPLCTGTSTSSIFAGGYDGTGTADKAESWDGTSWTEVGELNTARQAFGGGGANNASSLAVGGSPGTKANTEVWNGASWTELNDLSSGRSSVRSAGSSSNCIANGGYISAYSNLTEEWTSSLGNKTITES